MKRDEIWYLDIEGVLNRLKKYSLEEQEKIDDTLSCFKLVGIEQQELNKAIAQSTVSITFTLPYELSQHTIKNVILPMNDINLGNAVTSLKVQKVNNLYYYRLLIPNYESHLFKQFELKHQFNKDLVGKYNPLFWNVESVNILNKLYVKYNPKKIIITCNWGKDLEKTLDWMRIYGLNIPEEIIESFKPINKIKPIAIANDLYERKILNNYKIITSDDNLLYVCFANNVINLKPSAGLTKLNMLVYKYK